IVPSAVLVFIASPSKGILFLVLIIILMQFDGNGLGPKILGDSIGLGSFWILFSILFFGSLFGLLGMTCAVPVFAVIYRITKRWCALRLAKKDMPTETSCYRVPYNVAEEREERE
ncbi:MAG: AI-2E family transporter, partial [Lachnospiraceae bacterium]|nr:AI-2E family transporter [Lachnospiraceae bacterium]